MVISALIVVSLVRSGGEHRSVGMITPWRRLLPAAIIVLSVAIGAGLVVLSHRQNGNVAMTGSDSEKPQLRADLFPLAPGNRWHYDVEIFRPGNATKTATAVKRVADQRTIGGKQYARIVTELSGAIGADARPVLPRCRRRRVCRRARG